MSMTNYQYVFLEKDKTKPVFVLFHGTGGDEQDLISLAETINLNYSILSLRGNVNENGLLRFFKRKALNDIDLDNLQENTVKAIAFLKAAYQELGLTNQKKLAIGYSNGANFIAAIEQNNTSLFDGVILSHGNLYLPKPLLKHPELKVLVTMGENDRMIPPMKTKQMAQQFKDNGSDVTLYTHSMGHSLTMDEVESMKKWVETKF
ncbi:MAG: alpha/beta hydrolase [Erysipelothrix sp.]|nr:alpha/beta hydrolase [Erysipelothrix sp.]